LRLTVDRWIDMRLAGWFSGDMRVQELSPHAALLEGMGADVAVVSLLARETQEGFSNLLAFSGTQSALEKPGCLVAVNTLNTHPTLGAVALHDCHRPVYPLRFGGSGSSEDWSIVDWCDQCHRKRGLVVWADLPRLTEDFPQGEALAATILRKVDAFEIARFGEPEPAALIDWYHLLDCGLRLPLVGGSGKDSNAVATGAVRTYARCPPDAVITYAGWMDAVKTGHVFATNYPLLTMEVAGHEPGHVFTGELTGRPMQIHVDARSTVPFDMVEVLFNGRIVASRQASGNRQSALLNVGFAPDAPGWLAARCWGNERLADGQLVFAHTSPVYFHPHGGQPQATPEAGARFKMILDQTRDWSNTAARYEVVKSREHLHEVLGLARAVLASNK
ncbi:MAG: CehA/McbA family metallohydrolase, partial [Candidatus Acidiferrum sp.]